MRSPTNSLKVVKTRTRFGSPTLGLPTSISSSLFWCANHQYSGVTSGSTFSSSTAPDITSASRIMRSVSKRLISASASSIDRSLSSWIFFLALEAVFQGLRIFFLPWLFALSPSLPVSFAPLAHRP
eukprot:22103_5